MSYDTIADTRTLTHDEWLALRRTGIGGSDAGAIMGVSPYKGAFTVWADKQGKLPPLEDNEAMRQGRDLEDYVARRFAEASGLRVRHEYSMLRSVEHPFMLADIDRRIIGERAGLECKTSRDITMARYRNGEYPMEYYCQCLHYLAVTGWDCWYLAVLVYGTDLLIYKICRDEVMDDIQALIKAEEVFWDSHMVLDQPPAPDALDSTAAALGSVYPSEDGTTVCADQDSDQALTELAALKAQRRSIDRQILERENQIKAAMGEAEVLAGTSVSATWRSSERTTISKTKLLKAYPNINMDAITDRNTQRRFAIKEDKSNGTID